MKICPVCKIQKEVNDFHVNARVCKVCRSLQQKDIYKRKSEEIKARVYAYILENKETIRAKQLDKYKNDDAYRKYCLEYQMAYRKANKEKTLEYATVYREANREIVNKRISDYRKTPKGKMTQKTKHYRNRFMPKSEHSQFGKLTYPEWLCVLSEYNNQCPVCGTKDDLTIDHIIPLIHGGKHIKSNIQPLCRRCNSKKGVKIIKYHPNECEA